MVNMLGIKANFLRKLCRIFFYALSIAKTLFKGKTTGWIKSFKMEIKYSEVIQLNIVFLSKHFGI